MTRQTLALPSVYRLGVWVCALAGVVLNGASARADYNIKATEAASFALVTDAKCNLAEAVASLNSGYTAAGSGLYGCVNVGGGKRIVLEGTGAHYSVGTGITVWASGGIEITSKIANKDFVEGPANQFVIGIQSGSSLTLTGLTVQRTGSNKSQVLQNHGSLTITNSVIQGGDSVNDGGGIFNNGYLLLTGSTVKNNKAAFSGGGIYTQGPTGIILSNTTVSNNTSGLSGAGIFGNDSPLSLTLSTVSTNSSTSSHGGGIYKYRNTLYMDRATIQSNTAVKNGGGIYAYEGTVTMTGGKVTGTNTAVYGGGIYVTSGILTLTQATIEGASASADGGGIYNNGDLRTADSTVQNNKATGNGGGIYSLGGSGMYIERTTISNNTANQNGGGVYSSSRFLGRKSTLSTNTALGNGGGVYSVEGNNPYLELYFVTIGYNKAAQGGGAFVTGHTKTRTRSCIVAKNSHPDGTIDDYIGNPHGADPVEEGKLIHRSVFGKFLGSSPHYFDIEQNSNILPLANNGGLTKTHEIPTSSTALDAVPAGNAECTGSDQRGRPRPVGTYCDIGSYERQ